MRAFHLLRHFQLPWGEEEIFVEEKRRFYQRTLHKSGRNIPLEAKLVCFVAEKLWLINAYFAVISMFQ